MRLALVLLILGILLGGVLWVVGSMGDRRGVRGESVARLVPGSSPPAPEEPRPATRAAPPRESSAPLPTPEKAPPDDFPRSALAGRVERFDGTPASGIGVEVRHVDQRWEALPLARVKSGEQGGFDVLVPGTGPFRVRAFVESEGGTRLEALLETAEAGERSLRLALPRTGRLRGKVLDEEGRPVEEYTLLLRRSSGDAPLRTVVRSSDGSFASDELAYARWQLSLTAPGFDPPDPRQVTPLDEVTITLTRSARVRGFVRAQNGSGVGGVRVAAKNAETRSGPDGAFDLECTSGRLRLLVSDAPGTLPAPLDLDLRPGETREGILLRLGPAGFVSGRLLALDGLPAAGREVWLVPRDGGSDSPSVLSVTDFGGVFGTSLAPGAWEARVELTLAEIKAWQAAAGSEERAEHPYASESFTLAASGRAELWITLGPARVELRGTLTKAGEPHPGGELSVLDPRSGLVVQAVVVDSAYELGLARSGLHRFEVSFGKTTQVLWIEVGSLGPHALDFDVPVGWVEGRVRTWGGGPVPDARVEAVGALGGSGHAFTEPDGTFSLELVPDGYTISLADASDWSSRTVRQGGVDVRAGQRLGGLELVSLVDSAYLSLEVMLRTPGGQPVAEARVRLVSNRLEEQEPVELAVQRAPEGLARFYGLTGGQIELVAEAAGHVQLDPCTARIVWNETRLVVLELTPTREVFVSVRTPPSAPSLPNLDAVDRKGRVFPALRSRAEDVPETGAPEQERTWFRFEALPAGELLLRVFAGGEVREHPVRVLAGDGAPQTLGLDSEPESTEPGQTPTDSQ